jgi:hypothetical protein
LPSWNELVDEVHNVGTTLDLTRHKYIEEMTAVTGRNTIVYYSGWLQKNQPVMGDTFVVNDSDKNAFMAVIYKLDRTKGLDLVLHTPGGDIAATESLVDYLRSMFGNDIRAVVPQLAMSAGTMIALACRQIVMGKHSSIGPIDPQIGGRPAHAILEEFEAARNDIAANSANVALWQPIIAKYTPTLIGQCQKSIAWSQQIVKDWLISGMLASETDPAAAADAVLAALGDPTISKTHNRHISADVAKGIGVEVVDLEADQDLQSAVLTVHHACVLTLAQTNITKLVENQIGTSHVSIVEMGRS